MSIIERPGTVGIPAELEQAEEEILILRKAYELLSDQKNWCEQADAVDSHGIEGYDPWDGRVVGRCALSAIAWATGEQWDWWESSTEPSRYKAARERFGREVPGAPTTGGRGSSDKIIDLNDGPDGYDQVMEAFRRAIG